MPPEQSSHCLCNKTLHIENPDQQLTGTHFRSVHRVAKQQVILHLLRMFTIEHDFDATVVTLVDDGETPLQEDVIINAFASVVTLAQYDPVSDRVQKITLSMAQLRDLRAALHLPEGIYQFRESDG